MNSVNRRVNLLSSRSVFESLDPRRMLAAGDLDPTFGTTGVILNSFNPLFIPLAVKVLPDGRTVVAGRRDTTDGTGDIALQRLHVDGSIDASFGNNGERTVDLGGSESGNTLHVLPDGKLLVAGQSVVDGVNRLILVRLTADGSLDADFSDNGIAILAGAAAGLNGPFTSAVQSDGKIVLGADNRIVRVTADGQLDSGFGSNGVATLANDGRTGSVTSLFVADDGRIWTAGLVSGFRTEVLICRLTTSGQLDRTFSGDGRAFVSSLNAAFISPVAGNRALIATIGGNGDAITLRRLNADGGLDSTFQTSGTARVVVPGVNLSLRNVEPTSSGRMLAIGTTGNNATNSMDAFIARYDAAGAADLQFGGDGVVSFDAFFNNSINAIATAPDGKLVAAGFSSRFVSIDEFEYRTPYARFIGTDTAPSARITRTGTLIVQGSELAETIVIETTPNQRVRVSLNGIVTTFPARNVKRQAVFAGGGNDIVAMQSTIGASFEANGEAGNDLITGNGRDNVLRGGAGNDTLNGVGGRDALIGNAGADQLNGGSGEDILEAGSGNDTLAGAGGLDTLNGGDDTDTALDPASDVLISIENTR